MIVSTRVLAGAFVAAAIAMTSTAIAQPHKGDDATKTFKNAVALFDKKDYEDALPLFEAVHEQLQSPNASMYMGRCLRAMNKLPEAYDAFSVAVREATEKATKDPKYDATRDAAAAERSAVEASIARIVLVLPDPPEGATVTMNGSTVPRDQLGATIARTPGSFAVEATAPDRRAFHETVTVRGGSITQITILLPPNNQPVGAGPVASGSGPVAPVEPGGGVRVAGYFATGLGLAGAVTFIIAGVSSNNRFSAIEQDCHNMPCTDPALHGTIAGGRTLDIVADIGLGVGIAGLGAGVPMILFGGAKKPPPTTGFSVHASPLGARLGYESAF